MSRLLTDKLATQNHFFLLAAFAMLVLLKIPAVLDGRLWAEDGFFLVDALQQPWWGALTTQHTGYIDITASTIMLIAARITDLENVAIVSVVMALIMQVCPALLIITSRCQWLQPRTMIIALLLVLIPPIADEIWLSPVTSQYHLMVCAALILAFDVGAGWPLILRTGLLVIAGLTGPGPVLIAPLFLVRAYVDRSYPRLIQATILLTGALIEFAIFYTHPEVNRHLGIDPTLLLSIIYIKHILVPFLGHFAFDIAIDQSSISVVATLVLITGLALTAIKAHGREVRWLFAAAMTMMVLSYFGTLGGQANLLIIHFGQRYYYAPQVLLNLTLLGVAMTGRLVAHTIASVLVGWLIIVGLMNYSLVEPKMAHGPSWRDQIALWRADPSRPIAVWPESIQIRLR